MATNPLSTMRFHWSLGIFVIIFTRFSLISQSILHRFSCNFAGTTCNYSGDCPEKFVKFGRVFLKLLVRLVVNLLEYFKIYSFRRQFRRQFSTVCYVILQARKMREMPRQSQWPQTHCLQCVFTDHWAFLSSFLPVFRWYLSQFSTDFHVILQALPATIAATALRSL